MLGQVLGGATPKLKDVDRHNYHPEVKDLAAGLREVQGTEYIPNTRQAPLEICVGFR